MVNVILASGSTARADMLRNAGLIFETIPAKVDEATIKASLLADGAKPHDIADALAEYKALRVAGRHADALVIGADQVLVCDGQIFDKAPDMNAAREKLQTLRGRSHQLLSAAVIYEGGKPVWRTIGRAQLFMRDFSDAFLDEYLSDAGEDILSSVGCYLLESTGVTLFNRVQGDYFTVLGFPLLEVLGYLRTKGAIA